PLRKTAPAQIAPPEAHFIDPNCQFEGEKYLEGLRLPAGTSFPLYTNRGGFQDCPGPGIKRAIIVIHGINRTALNYFNYIMEGLPQPPATSAGNDVGGVSVNGEVTNARGVSKVIIKSSSSPPQLPVASPHGATIDTSRVNRANAIVIAPYFAKNNGGDDCDPPVCPGHDDYRPSFISWSVGWKTLAPSDASHPYRLSSAEVVDRIVQTLLDEALYPDLDSIVIVGHSAGGQFVTRYAITNPVHDEMINRGIEVRYIVANPSAYLYLDETRYDQTAEVFAVPQTTCSQYNKYGYGLNSPNQYVTAALSEIVDNARTRPVYLLIGDADNFDEGNLDTSCGAMLQGDHRYERAQWYYRYLGQLFPEGHNTKLLAVPNVGHNTRKMFLSPKGAHLIFE
ncbi:MAG TPA: hypothetical protein VJC18_08160, partial [bacterium]|nr:hypothetical protein [bacterium]